MYTLPRDMMPPKNVSLELLQVRDAVHFAHAVTLHLTRQHSEGTQPQLPT